MQFFSNLKKRVSTFALLAMSMVVASPAFAQATTTLASSAATEITAAKAEVLTIQTAMIGVLILLVVFALIRRAFGK